MMKKGIFMSTLSLAAILAACDCCPQGEAKALSQDKELRAVMDNFTQKVYQVFGKIYQQQAQQAGADAGQSAGGQQTNDDGTVDADYDVK